MVQMHMLILCLTLLYTVIYPLTVVLTDFMHRNHPNNVNVARLSVCFYRSVTDFRGGKRDTSSSKAGGFSMQKTRRYSQFRTYSLSVGYFGCGDIA